MNNVYIVQEIMKKNSDGYLESVYDITPAAIYGNLEVLISGRRHTVLSTQPLIYELKDKLRSFNDNDCLLLIGDPVLIGIAVAVVSEINAGKVPILKWDRETARYIKIKCDFRMK